MVAAYIGLGSNLDDPAARIASAIQSLSRIPATTFLRCSSRYHSRPQGPRDQPDYINAVAQVDTRLSAGQLLECLQAIEKQQGRVHTRRWGPRTLDLDLLLFGDSVLRSDTLTLPHPEMHRRAFVLYPLYEIAPDIEIPGHGPIGQLLREVDHDEVEKLAPE